MNSWMWPSCPAAHKANHMLGCLEVGQQVRGGDCPTQLCSQKPHLEYNIQLWSP